MTIKKETNFRKLTLKSGKEITAGKDSEQNDLLIEQSKKNDLILHTLLPGSPFVNLGEKPTKDEIEQGAVFCALKSQDFRDNKNDVKVNLFLRSDCFKDPKMKNGTWGVKKNLKTIKVKKIDIINLRREISRL